MKFCKKASSIVFTRGRKLVAYYTINIFYSLSDPFIIIITGHTARKPESASVFRMVTAVYAYKFMCARVELS